jgi:hypothetical protein
MSLCNENIFYLKIIQPLIIGIIKNKKNFFSK